MPSYRFRTPAQKKEQSAAGEKQTSKQTRTVQRPYLTGLATRLEEPCRFEATRHARTAEVPTRPSSESRECLACTGSRLAQRTMTSPYIAECSRGRIRTTRPVRQDAGESHHAREQPLQSGLLTAKKLCFGAPQVAHLSGLVEDGVVACTSRPLHMPAKKLGRTPATQSYARMHTFLALA
jgi:hypothetical protein